MSHSSYFCILLLMSLFHFCLSNQSINHVLCKDVERQALLQFKQGLIDYANKLDSWVGEEKECCRWVGIVCDNSTGHVHQIRLRNQMLGGDLSSSLLHLEQLEHLDLSCNDFGGIQVPGFIGSFENLRYLNLSVSWFGELIPPQLGNLSKLQVLCLESLGSLATRSSSYDEDYIYESTKTLNMQWLSSLHRLHHLDMSGVDLSEAIDWFQVINTLPSLTELRLSGCRLLHTHRHVPTLNLTSLSLLDLSNNDFYDNNFVLPWISSTTSLVSLDLSECYFPRSNSIDIFRNLTSLKLLYVSGNKFMSSSLVLKGLSSSVGSNLISLGIGSCGISSSGLLALHNLTSLLNLDLSYNQLTKAIPKSLGNLCNLKEIDLSINEFHNINLTNLLEFFFECKSPSLESLFLEYSGLSGNLPGQVGQLTHLVHLNLGVNGLVGVIPNSIGQLSCLRFLHLYKNLVFGPIPYSIGGLSSLEMLDLSDNRLNGSLPDSLGQLLKLDRLDLSHNQLTGNVPGSLGQLSKLNYLDLSSNLLAGVVTEAHFAKLIGMKYLNGTGNNLILTPQVANWIPPFQLQYLYLRSWDLGPQFPLWLQSQKGLFELDMSNTNISAPMPESFLRSFPNLDQLDMSQNHIHGTLINVPATFRMLDLSSNEFNGQIPYISNGSGPLVLDLSNNFFEGSLQHLLCPYDEKTTEVLNLGNNRLSGVIPECWVKWSSLSFLNLENNDMSGEIPRTLGFSFNLYSLNMRGNKLSGRLPTSLMNLTNLRFLQLGKNELIGCIPSSLWRKLSLLKSLDLRSNNFDGNIPQELCYLTKIHILDLAHNNLSGYIPRCFNKLSVLSGKETGLIDAYDLYSNITKHYMMSESLVIKGREDKYSTILGLVSMMDLSSNNFVGQIPSELTGLRKLKSLNLSRNQLTGRIPKKIGDMKSLESFDLSLNKLSGELPMTLSRLSFLSSFNVSYNSFTGRIPSGTQLQSLNESSFFGNNLCGDPLIERCAGEVHDKDHKEEEKEDRSDGPDWGLIISMAFGLVVGFWIIVAPLMVSRSWRIAYFRFLIELGYMAYDVTLKYCCNMFFK